MQVAKSTAEHRPPSAAKCMYFCAERSFFTQNAEKNVGHDENPLKTSLQVEIRSAQKKTNLEGTLRF